MPMEDLLTPDRSSFYLLAALFAATFLAATLLPLSSELALFAVLHLHPELLWVALGIATLGNTAGGMLNYGIGRLIAHRLPPEKLSVPVRRLRHWGAPATALGWLPFIGEALCLAAGYLKLSWASVVAWQLAGRGLRYWVVAQAVTI
jgi:membrane protein YqaA with SNARE-associated domain